MAPKRKSDVLEPSLVDCPDSTLERAFKKPRASDATDSSSSSSSKALSSTPRSWKDVKLEGEDEDGVPVYDDCGEVRRKIRLLQKTPGWKVTQWLREIGGINNNSYGRFMREKGKTDGASNGTYYAAYVYFEKVRIFEGKNKTATRKNNESSLPNGFPLENRRHVWVFTGR
ncbi:hypothetical protein M413DRAFT_219993 [Hebeloma cylindrosporum]|uniref:DUF7726 domain-containing protein n=1 Tax=Hebeloma cylindrosporum TaxID=76867 RepID=A0A0C3CH49_HEBCY|nr:hypothetical protein M413DRAFT_219993 [Hebeloma cylindrosporum h7]